jgi:hypothetical protein
MEDLEQQGSPDGGAENPDGKTEQDVSKKIAYLESLNKDLIKQRDEAKAKNRLEEEARLKEQNKYKELYESKEQELTRLADEKKELEAIKVKYLEFDKAERETLKSAFSDKWMPSFETLDIAELKKIANTFLGDKYLYTPPKSGGGKGANKDPKDMSEAEYIAFRNAGGKI